MKKLTPLLLFISLILVGCSSINDNSNIKNDNSSIEEATSTVDKTTDNTNSNKEATSTPETVISASYQVDSVIDGDTIKVNINGKIETIRMIGIDTPEIVDPRKIVQCFGKEASNKAKEWLSGKTVILEADPVSGERDKYNRLLRFVRVKDGMFYNLEIIKQGYAHEYTYNSEVYKYQTDFKNAEKYARENKLGLWADNTCGGDTTKSATNPTPTPTPAPTPTPIPTCNCSSNVYNCDDFKTHSEAQVLYVCCGGVNNDIHRLDGNKDGQACESLP